MNAQRKSILLLVLLGCAWVCTVALGLIVLFRYETTAGAVGSIGSQWPAGSKVELASDGLTLVMFAHPQCPCTRASMTELERIVAHAQGKVRSYVLFYRPGDGGADWDNTGLRRSAAAIPGVTVLSDIDGTEAHRFGSTTSGHTFLFDENGRLLFAGGITATRGHAGDNVGENAIVSLINSRTSQRDRTLVFGCSLVKRAKGTEDTKLCLK